MRLLSIAAIAWFATVGHAAAKEIVGAEYTGPTRAYPHGVLGDDEEWSALNIEIRRQRGSEGSLFQGHLTLTYTIDAPEDMVFEDIAPRLWDITGDGSPEVVVVVSHQNYGAQLAVIGLEDGDLTYIASTPTIGTRFRWLAPVGAADFDGDGFIEIAFVDRPHLARTLRVWRYTPDGFGEIATLPGVTNHRIGEDFISGGVRDCGDGAEMLVADAKWRSVQAVRLKKSGLAARSLSFPATQKGFSDALACKD
jgi:hypothetical protein